MADNRPIPDTRAPYADPDVTFRADVANLVDDLRGSGMASPPPADLDSLSQPSIEDEAMQDRIDDGMDDGLIRLESQDDVGLRPLDEIVGGGVTGTLADDRLDPGAAGFDDAAEGEARSPSERGYDEAVATDDLDDDLPDDVGEALARGDATDTDGEAVADEDDAA